MTLFINLLTVLSWAVSHSDQGLSRKRDDSLAIQYLDLRVNPLLFSEVKRYIKEQQDSCQIFKNGFGYVTLAGIKLGRNGRPIEINSLENHAKDIEVEFNIGLSSYYPHDGVGLPVYYSYVDNRLVLIYEQNLKWIHRNAYSATSENKVKELIKQSVLQVFSVDFDFKGCNGESTNTTSEQRARMSQEKLLEIGSFVLQKLKRVTQYVDGSISYQYIKLGKVR